MTTLDDFVHESIDMSVCLICSSKCNYTCMKNYDTFYFISINLEYGYSSRYPMLFNLYKSYISYIKKGYSIKEINGKMSYINNINIDEIYDKSITIAKEMFIGKRLECELKYLKHFYITISNYYYCPVLIDGCLYCPYFDYLGKKYGYNDNGVIKRFIDLN